MFPDYEVGTKLYWCFGGRTEIKFRVFILRGLLLNTDSDLMANMYIVLNCRRKLLEHAYGYYGMELKLAFSSL
jgi:hypothetical protein